MCRQNDYNSNLIVCLDLRPIFASAVCTSCDGVNITSCPEVRIHGDMGPWTHGAIHGRLHGTMDD